jgi:hypothetical protein
VIGVVEPVAAGGVVSPLPLLFGVAASTLATAGGVSPAAGGGGAIVVTGVGCSLLSQPTTRPNATTNNQAKRERLTMAKFPEDKRRFVQITSAAMARVASPQTEIEAQRPSPTPGTFFRDMGTSNDRLSS